MSNTKLFIYVLQLEHGKYYVGKTTDTIGRIIAHINGIGTPWTTKYKPQQIYEIKPDCDDYDEDKITLKYMKEYGIHNVRGGTFCKIDLDEEQIRIINQMINGSENRCYICGELNHLSMKCPANISNTSSTLNTSKTFKIPKTSKTSKIPKTPKTSKKNQVDKSKPQKMDLPLITGIVGKTSIYDVWMCKECDEFSEDESEMMNHPCVGIKIDKSLMMQIWVCDLCGKSFMAKNSAQMHKNFHCKKRNSNVIDTHNSEAKTDGVSLSNTNENSNLNHGDVIHSDVIHGDVVNSDVVNSDVIHSDVNNHDDVDCSDSNKNGSPNARKSPVCYRCGRYGHLSTNCYATHHLKGYTLNFK